MRYDDNIGVMTLTGAGDKAFCSGGDQKVRGDPAAVGELRRTSLERAGLPASECVPVRNRLSRWWLAFPSAVVTLFRIDVDLTVAAG